MLRGAGALASAVGGITTFGPSFLPAVAAFNGAGLSAYEGVWLDFTINELNRLNDSAYASNTVVKSKSAKVVVAFVPIDLFLSAAEKKRYWKQANELFQTAGMLIDLRKLLVLVVAEHVVPKGEIQPLLTDVVISSEQIANLLTKEPVSGYILGRFLEDASPAIEEAEELGLSIDRDSSRESTDDRLYFVVTPTKIPKPNQLVLFQAVREDFRTTHGERLTHRFAAPTLVVPDTPLSGIVGQDVPITLQGSGLYEGHVEFVEMDGIEVVNIEASTDSVSAMFKISGNAQPGQRNIQAEVNDVRTGTVPLEIRPAGDPG